MIFISHSSADGDAVHFFVTEIIQKSLGFSAGDFFYSSAPGTRLRAGTDIDDGILEKIQESDLIIYFLSPNFMETRYCLCEMGAAWALGKKIFPIILPELKKSEVPAIISRNWIKKMEDETLNDLKDIVSEIYPKQIRKIASAHISATNRKFLEKYPDFEGALPPPKAVPHEELVEAKELSDYYSKELDKTQSEIESLKQQIEDIKKLHSQKDIDQYYLSKSTIEELYETLRSTASAAINFSGYACKMICFYIYTNNDDSEQRVRRLFREDSEQIDAAIDRKYFNYNGSSLEFTVKSSHIKEALDNLWEFLSDDSYQQKEAQKKYKYTDDEHQVLLNKLHEDTGIWPDMGDLDYWEKALF